MKNRNAIFVVLVVGILAYGQYLYKSIKDNKVECANLISISKNKELTGQIWVEMIAALEEYSDLNTSITAHYTLIQKLQTRFSSESSIAFSWSELTVEFRYRGNKILTPHSSLTDEIRLNDGADTRQLVFKIKPGKLAGGSLKHSWANRDYDASVHCRSDVHGMHPPR